MKIGFDGKRAVSNMTGLGNYSRLVIEELGKKFRHLRNLQEESRNSSGKKAEEKEPEFGMYIGDPKKRELEKKDWQLLVYTPKMKRNPRLEPLRRLDNVEFRFPPSQGLSGGLWRTFGISNNIKTDGCDLYHGLSNELPLNIRTSGVKSVVTIHDLIYRRLPECYRPIDRFLYDFKYGRSCRNADRIIAVSECTKRDISDIYEIDPEKIDVVYQGCDDIFRVDITPTDIREAKKRLGLPDRYIAQVGTVESRKNLELTLRALSALPKDISLVVVGGDHHGYRQKMQLLAGELGVADRVVWLQGIDFHDLPVVYSQAEVSAYPSRYEGFGIPIIESLECRTPVVAAKGSCLEEAGGEGAIYVDPDSPQEMVQAILQLIEEKGLYDRMTKAGKQHVRKFDNATMADRILSTYRRTLGEEEADRLGI